MIAVEAPGAGPGVGRLRGDRHGLFPSASPVLAAAAPSRRRKRGDMPGEPRPTLRYALGSSNIDP